MSNIYKVIKRNEKSNINNFFHGIVGTIGYLNLGREASVNEIITSYGKESTLY